MPAATAKVTSGWIWGCAGRRRGAGHERRAADHVADDAVVVHLHGVVEQLRRGHEQQHQQGPEAHVGDDEARGEVDGVGDARGDEREVLGRPCRNPDPDPEPPATRGSVGPILGGPLRPRRALARLASSGRSGGRPPGRWGWSSDRRRGSVPWRWVAGGRGRGSLGTGDRRRRAGARRASATTATARAPTPRCRSITRTTATSHSRRLTADHPPLAASSLPHARGRSDLCIQRRIPRDRKDQAAAVHRAATVAEEMRCIRWNLTVCGHEPVRFDARRPRRRPDRTRGQRGSAARLDRLEPELAGGHEAAVGLAHDVDAPQLLGATTGDRGGRWPPPGPRSSRRGSGCCC